jgi:hypothetical protein
MRKISRRVAVLGLMVGYATVLRADFSCSGVLTESQRRGFEAMFSPAYSPSLTHIGGAVTPANMAKSLTGADLKRLFVSKPLVVENAILSQQHATLLKGWLNANASATVPGWVSTTVGIIVPQAWVGLAADVFVQLINGAGDAGRQNVANMAGTVSEGGAVGVTEQVAVDSSGKRKFLWTYVYQANLNNKLLTSPLSICSSDVAVTGQ